MSRIDLISASAGSGKTYRLTHDLADGVAAGIEPEQCMAITFTNAAAAEIASRIRRTLLEAGRWELAQRALDGYLGTVHSVCGEIIEEFAFEAGLSPELDIVPAEEARLLFNRAIATIAGDPEVVARLDGPARRMAIEDWREMVQKVVEAARANGLDSDAVRRCGERSWASMAALYEPFGDAVDGDALDRALEHAIMTAIAAIRESSDSTKGTATVLASLETAAATIRNDGVLTWSEWVRLSKAKPTKASVDAVAPVNEAAAKHVVHARLRDDLRALITGVFDCAARSMEAFARYKADAGLIDFADQEALTLGLLERDDVRATLGERLATVYVDEFQDTSPIQLALMLRLASCARRSVWIGDQKQSIYGFRGADPSLMDAVIKALSGSGELTILETSWRSRPALVEFANELFSAAFAPQGIPRERVALTAARAETAGQRTALVQWRYKSTNAATDHASIAAGVAAMLDPASGYLVVDPVSGYLAHDPATGEIVVDREHGRLRPVRGGDIAVLCRQHTNCDAIAAELARLGLRVSISRAGLLGTHECILAFAALRYLVDRRDTLAAAELVHYHGVDAGAAGRATSDAWLGSWIDARRAASGGGRSGDSNSIDDNSSDSSNTDNSGSTDSSRTDDSSSGDGSRTAADGHRERRLPPHPVLDRIDAERSRLLHLTPSETLEVALAVAGVEEQAARWGNAASRLANIDALRGLARGYEDRCLSRRAASTAAGLVTFLSREAPGDRELDRQPESNDPDAVNIRTYHASKGLEWPVVILGELDAWKQSTPFGVCVEPVSGGIDMSDPLAGRWVRWWPWPYERQSTETGIDDTAAVSDAGMREARRRHEENIRLLYVGVTRARDYLVLPMRAGGGAKWLTRLEDADEQTIVTLADDPGDPRIEVMGKRFLTAYDLLERGDAVANGDATEVFIGTPSPEPPPHYPPLRMQPSAAPAASIRTGTLRTETLATWPRLALVGAVEMTSVGEAMHRFLAIDDPARDAAVRTADAARILEAWGPGGLQPAQLIEASDRLHTFIAGRWPGATLHREWPVAMRVGDRRMSGRIDLIVETADGVVIVDHKTFPGADATERLAGYAAQLGLYRRAMEECDLEVEATIVYLPVGGTIVALT